MVIHLVCTHAVHHRCLRALRTAHNSGPVVRSRTHGGFQGGARAQGARRQAEGLDIG